MRSAAARAEEAETRAEEAETRAEEAETRAEELERQRAAHQAALRIALATLNHIQNRK